MKENDFFSIERLMEFGFGLSIAQQMVASMKEAMNSMQLPGEQRFTNLKELSFYVAIEDNPAGPFSESDVFSLISNKQLTKDSLVWRSGMSSWAKVQDVPEILRLIAISPPPIPKEGNK